MTAYLTMRQREEPPIDRRSPRRLRSAGGRAEADPQTLAVGIEDEKPRYPGTVFDTEIMRDRGPWYKQSRYMPPGVSWVSWTAAGPARPELHMRNATLREMVGNSRSRFPVVDSPTGGMHTMTPSGVSRTVPRYVTTPQMQSARINRLSPGQYSGQTYSQTTAIQGRRGRR